MTFESLVIKSYPTGSRYICDPPVMDTDRDTLIFVHNVPEAEVHLFLDGWEACGDGEYVDGYFKAYRKGIDNYILTSNVQFFDRYVIATNVAKVLNARSKKARIKIFEACLYSFEGCIGLIKWDDWPILGVTEDT